MCIYVESQLILGRISGIGLLHVLVKFVVYDQTGITHFKLILNFKDTFLVKVETLLKNPMESNSCNTNVAHCTG